MEHWTPKELERIPADDMIRLRREAAAFALEEFADHVATTWGMAYPEDIFPAILAGNEISPTKLSRASAGMGRHMAAAIERELRQWAERKRRGDDE